MLRASQMALAVSQGLFPVPAGALSPDRWVGARATAGAGPIFAPAEAPGCWPGLGPETSLFGVFWIGQEVPLGQWSGCWVATE